MIALVVFSFVFLFRLMANIYRYFATKHYYKLYKSKKKLSRIIRPVEYLFNKAGTQRTAIREDRSMVYAENISDQLSDDSAEPLLMEAFENTLGVYAFRIRQNFYLFYWLTLPIYVLSGSKLSTSKPIGRLLNLLIWILGTVAAYFLERYLDSVGAFDQVLSMLGIHLK